VSAEVIDVRNRLVGHAKENLIDNASVIISVLSVLIAAGALLLGGVAMYIAFDATRDAKEFEIEMEVWQIYTANLHADLRAHGFEPLPLPEK